LSLAAGEDELTTVKLVPEQVLMPHVCVRACVCVCVYHLLVEYSTYVNGTTCIFFLQQNKIRDREGNKILGQTQYSEFEN